MKFRFRQYYIYATDTTCKRMGTQCWVYCAIMLCEGILCVKNGPELFSQTHIDKVVSWLAIQAFLSTAFVCVVMLWHKFFDVSLSRI
jgi:phosphatidylserine synthase 1